jgi:hypothetical protein
VVLISIRGDYFTTMALVSILCCDLQRIIPFLFVNRINLFTIFHDNHFIRIRGKCIFCSSFLFKHNRKVENRIFFDDNLNQNIISEYSLFDAILGSKDNP